jgi:endonuclease/exonuclease/phosphatase family metal-dependent hydrolase
MLSTFLVLFRRLVPLLLVLAVLVAGCDSAGDDQTGSSADTTTVADAVDGFTSQPAPIVVDGRGNDWTELNVRQADVGDGEGSTGIERLWVAHTQQHLFFRVTVDQSLNLQEDNDLTLYLDADNDPTTGQSALGLGAELEWTFGNRAGSLGGDGRVRHEDIGIASLPTVRTSKFEVALDRSAQPSGEPLFSGDSLRIGLSSDGDRVPDTNGGLGYVLSDPETTGRTPSIDRPSASDLRLLSYNVLRSSIFDGNAQQSYRRILEAADPDIIGYQEVYEYSATETEQVSEGALDISDAWNWAKVDLDLVLGTRYPILDTYQIPGGDGLPSGAFLVDAKEALGDSLIVVLMHPKCCSGISEDQSRQETVDGVAAFLRDVTRGEGPFGVGAETPVAVVGDMNFVGDAQQPRTLRTGQIQNTGQFGRSASPDWDDSSLLDTNPRQTGAPLHTTTFSPGGFPPGRLDYAYVTDSVLDVVHELALTTRPLSDAILQEQGLQRDDTPTASDHLPVVLDLTLR